MRLTGSRVYTRPTPVPKMPPGLVELMEGLTKDVLKNNPADIYEFCADHMKKLLEIRDGDAAKQNSELPLERKILRAQEKVRKRAEQRRQRYDMLHTDKCEEHKIQENRKEIDLKTVLEMNNLKAPIHHEQDLEKASEIEIFHGNGEKNNSPMDGIDYGDKKINEELVKDENGKTHEQQKDDNVLDNATVDSEIISDTNFTVETTNLDHLDEHVIKDRTIMSIDEFLPDISEKNVEENDNVVGFVNAEGLETVNLKNEVEDLKNTSENVNNKSIKSPTNEDDIINPDSMIQNENEDGFEQDNSDIIPSVTNNIEEGVEAIENLESICENSDEISLTNVINGAENDLLKESSEVITDAPISFTNSGTGSHNTEIKNNLITDSNVKNADDITKILSTDSSLDKIAESPLVKQEIYDNECAAMDKPTDEVFEPSLPGNKADSVNKSHEILLTEQETENIKNNSIELTENISKSSSDLKVDVMGNGNEIRQTENKAESNENIESVESVEKISAIPVTDLKIDSSENSEVTANIENTVSLESTDNPAEFLSHEQKVEDSVIENKVSTQTTFDNAALSDLKIDEKDTVQSLYTDPIDVEPVGQGVPKTDIGDMRNGDSVANMKSIDNDAKQVVETDNINDINNSASNENNLDVDTSKLRNDDDTSSGNMDLETAAITIQKVFRTFLFKSRASTFDESVNDDSSLIEEDNDKKDEIQYQVLNSTLNKERRTLGISRMDTVLQTVNEEKSLSLSTDDSSTLSSAATIIQAHVRGFLVRNKLNSGKTVSTNSLVYSDGPSTTSLDIAEAEQHKNKTILNIHIVPEGANFSRDESIITSMDLSLDGSPPSSVNLHPLGYDKSERRKQLKREDAIQSVSPPSNNSGKLSEDVDSVKEVLTIDNAEQGDKLPVANDTHDGKGESHDTTPTKSLTIETVVELTREMSSSPEQNSETIRRRGTLTKMSSDEMDVVTPFLPSDEKAAPENESNNTSKLMHSGEFHDTVLLPTKISRGDTSVVSGE